MQSKYYKEEDKPEYKKEEDYNKEVSTQTWGWWAGAWGYQGPRLLKLVIGTGQSLNPFGEQNRSRVVAAAVHLAQSPHHDRWHLLHCLHQAELQGEGARVVAAAADLCPVITP